MAKNYNIQTDSVHLAETAASHTITIGAVVPAGMTRYVTFIRATPLTAANNVGSKVYLCSTVVAGAASAATACAAQKLVAHLVNATAANNKDVMVPASPDTEHPLFTVAAGAYLRAHLATDVAAFTASVQLFVQYYDE